MIAVLHPSFWQQSVAGLAVTLSVIVPCVVGLWWFERAVLVPRAASRAWVEGSRLRPLVEAVVAVQRRAAPGAQDDVLVGVRVGCALAICAVVPLSSGLVSAQPTGGVFVLAGALLVDALAHRSMERVGLAALVGLVSGAVAVQWGTSVVPEIAHAQAHSNVMTFWIQPWLAAVALFALHATFVDMRSRPSSLADMALVVAVSGWWVAVFAGGGVVPWPIDNPGTRHVVSVVVFMAKLTVVSLLVVWSNVTWPTVSVRWIRQLLLGGSGVTVVALGVTAWVHAVV